MMNNTIIDENNIKKEYPVVNALDWAKKYFKSNPNVAGMAVGGGMNGIEGVRQVILNPYTKYNKESIIKNERLRHWMDEFNFELPNVSKELLNKYKGTTYDNDTLNIGRTEAARYLSGDKHLLTKEQMNYINGLNIPTFKKGSGIHIKKENRGKFTDYCDGKVTQECIDKAKKSGNKKLVKRAVFAENARKWKHQKGGLILKFQNPAQPIKRLDVNGLRNDPEYKKNFNWKMHDANLALIQDSLIARNADFPERVAILGLVIPESGGYTEDHGNGASGYVGWRGPRAINLPKDAPGQAHKLMSEIYDNPTAKDWSHGGIGTGVLTGKEMMNLFLNTLNVQQAGKAFMKGYVRPEKSEWNKRLRLTDLVKKHMK